MSWQALHPITFTALLLALDSTPICKDFVSFSSIAMQQSDTNKNWASRR